MARAHRMMKCVYRLMALCLGVCLALISSLPHDFGGREFGKVHQRSNTPKAAPGRQNRTLKTDIITHKISSREIKVDPVINTHPYNYVLTPDGVCKPQTFIVVFVHSAPAFYRRRQLIRKTWANSLYQKASTMVVIFAIGSSRNVLTRTAIRNEHAAYKDILSESFVDHYRNLTHKAVGALKWILNECPMAKFLIKTDDDTLMNVFAVVRHLRDLDRTGQRSGLLMCRRVERGPVMRTGKWAVHQGQYPDTHYPPYCSGLAYIMSADVARSLYESSFRTRIVWVDDVWLTGLVVKTAGIRIINISHAYSLNKAFTEKAFLGRNWYQYMFAHLGPVAFRNVWKKMLLLANSQKIPETKEVVPGIVVKK